jgi:hypothetical protein
MNSTELGGRYSSGICNLCFFAAGAAVSSTPEIRAFPELSFAVGYSVSSVLHQVSCLYCTAQRTRSTHSSAPVYSFYVLQSLLPLRFSGQSRPTWSLQNVSTSIISALRYDPSAGYPTHHTLSVKWKLVDLLPCPVRGFYVRKRDESLSSHSDVAVGRDG